MAAAICIKVVALVALVSVFGTHGARAQPSYNASSARRELYYSSTTGGSWQPAMATWYGRPNGAGPDNNGVYVCHARDNAAVFLVSSALALCLAFMHACVSIVVLIGDRYGFAGGGCGYSGTNLYPFNSMTSCGDHKLFNDGKGCGACYQVLRET